MANTILTPEVIAREALMVLRNNAVMPKLVHRDYSDEFVGAVGDTITVRKPATFTANEFTGSIQVQDATETGVAVKMDKHLDVSFAVTSKQMTMDIADFSAQLLVPAMQAFADKVDKYIIAEAKKGGTFEVEGEITTDNVIDARRVLNSKAAPLANRSFVCGPNDEASLLKSELFVSAEKVGDNGTALREASLGRKFGFDCYVDQNLDNAIAFHKNAIALVTRPLALPQGAAKAAIVNYDGFGLRVVYGYDINTKQDTISIDMLCGTQLLDGDLVAASV